MNNLNNLSAVSGLSKHVKRATFGCRYQVVHRTTSALVYVARRMFWLSWVNEQPKFGTLVVILKMEFLRFLKLFLDESVVSIYKKRPLWTVVFPVPTVLGTELFRFLELFLVEAGEHYIDLWYCSLSREDHFILYFYQFQLF